MKTQVLYEIKPPKGTELRCKGWRQEGLLRMLENNLANAEAPEKLVIYGGNGTCARNWESYHAIVKSLTELENDETLVMQSGMPVAVFKTHRLAPRVVMANTNFLPATWDTYFDLRDKNLMMHGQYTAGPWEYIGTQGVIQGTFEILAVIAEQKFNGSLEGKILLSAGVGGMGGNQGKAMALHGGCAIIPDADERVIKRRMKAGFIDKMVHTFDEALELVNQAIIKGEALSVAILANAADIFEECLEKNFIPDILTEMTPCHDPSIYIPSGYTGEEADKYRASDRDAYMKEAYETMKRQLRVMNAYYDKGVETFEYGTSIRKECMDAGMAREEALKIPGFLVKYVRPLFCEGRGPFRWLCLSGDSKDQKRLDDLALELFKGDEIIERWIKLASEHLPIESLPARICFLGYGQRKAFALAVNELIRNGEVGPVAFTRDNLDVGSIANPLVETQDMKDGSDSVTDWVYLNGLLNVASMADLVSLQANGSMGTCIHNGATIIADGSEEAELRLEAYMNADVGLGVVRHAHAGYEKAVEVISGDGPLTNDSIKIPLWWTREATYGPEDL
ncbi:urocanate hydratase [Acidaminobacter sp. JC074]|uniref:urocanate hydratase n=1 Tax=Acidaminobacter sp. JC074 TaxID=2530199 RepID=UPI001F113186|nr:urocanate hydratase [Acidaminobacter sp. JC074]MCH4890179.1 urocanate hydratase [Acidaminobacter sp. JC074]